MSPVDETAPREPLLVVDDLRVEIDTDEGPLRVVDGVSFEIARGRTLGLVGESGSGKSVTALSLLRLVPGGGRISSGRVLLRGQDVAALPEREVRRLRGDRISMVFQEPMTSLNPVLTVGEQIAEAVRLHQGLSRRAARDKAVEMLRATGVSAPDERVRAYPHQLSGGMRQRVMIAIALACRPDVLVADEPTTALDVTIQAQILDLIGRLQRELGMGVLLITHDLGVVAETCDEVAVMYCGRIVERAPVAELFAAPRHPYTVGLLRSHPGFARAQGEGRARRLHAIPGVVPRLRDAPHGCRFQDRCDRVVERCREAEPPLVEISPGRSLRCFRPVDEPAAAGLRDAAPALPLAGDGGAP